MYRVKERLAKMERRHLLAAAIVVVLFAVAVVGATTLLVAYLQKPTTTSTEVTVSGKLVCLPHKNTDGPQTLECAFGLRTDDNRHYALQYSPFPTEHNVGDRLQVTGQLTTGEDTIYDIVGTIKVTKFSSAQ